VLAVAKVAVGGRQCALPHKQEGAADLDLILPTESRVGAGYIAGRRWRFSWSPRSQQVASDECVSRQALTATGTGVFFVDELKAGLGRSSRLYRKTIAATQARGIGAGPLERGGDGAQTRRILVDCVAQQGSWLRLWRCGMAASAVCWRVAEKILDGAAAQVVRVCQLPC